MKNNTFLWGGSSSAFQYEGGANEGGKGESMYDAKSKSGKVDYSTTSDFYHRYKEDIGLMAEMGYTGFRMSIAWTRIFPNGDDLIVNQEGVDFYNNVFDELKRNNIEPVVTLFHWDLPQSLIDRFDGFYGEETVQAFTRYCKTCFELFGDRVKYWLTLNENNLCLLLPSFFTKTKVKPDDENYETFRLKVYHNMNIAHFESVRLCHELVENGKIGCMIASSYAYPLTPDPKDINSAIQHNQSTMYDYLDLLTKGNYNHRQKFMFEQINATYIQDESFVKLATNPNSKIDFISFSYYFTICTQAEENKTQENAETMQIMYEAYKNPKLQSSTFGWTIDPMGLRIFMNDMYDRYDLPLLLVENGLGVEDDVLEKDGTVHDPYRIEYLKDHITELLNAINEDHVNCFGFLPWGTIDLYSAGGNKKKRYGFVYVDYDDDYKRYRKDSFYWYKNVILTNGEVL